MSENRRSYPFIGEGKVNVGRIAAVEFEDGPHSGTHLLALHVGGIRRTHKAQKPTRVAMTASYRLARRVSLSSGTAPIISLAD
jgi:hypothetical protein